MVMIEMARDVTCMKHCLEDQLATARREYLAIERAAKELPPHLLPVLMYFEGVFQDVRNVFLATDCTCWEGPDTVRIGGASWVSDGDDVANLQDVWFGLVE